MSFFSLENAVNAFSEAIDAFQVFSKELYFILQSFSWILLWDLRADLSLKNKYSCVLVAMYP